MAGKTERLPDGPGLDDFRGTWRIDRRIEDRRTGELLHLTGLARLSPMNGGLCYEEEGELTMTDGRVVRASRRYLWREEEERIAVDFPDGRFFHSFDPQADLPDARHWCDPDAYDVRYDLSGWPEWRVIWNVQGPRKDYVMTTLYRPVD